MASTILVFSLLTIFSRACAEEHPDAARSAYKQKKITDLADVVDRDTVHAGHTIEASENRRIKLQATGITMMEGVSVQEASGRSSAGLVRRESDGAVLAEKKAARTRRAVTWEECGGEKPCQCGATIDRPMVIRYQRERHQQVVHALRGNRFTNWYYRWWARPYNFTPPEEFSKGFKNIIKNGVVALQMCGGDHAGAMDCRVEPMPCEFDTNTSNPYDAKAGEYCCNGDMHYCSYKCVGDEEFKCPSFTTDINFPGGMDPTGPDGPKRCYIADYTEGMNPEFETSDEVEGDSVHVIT